MKLYTEWWGIMLEPESDDDDSLLGELYRAIDGKVHEYYSRGEVNYDPSNPRDVLEIRR